MITRARFPFRWIAWVGTDWEARPYRYCFTLWGAKRAHKRALSGGVVG